MSQENVELVLASVSAYNAGNLDTHLFESVAAIRGFLQDWFASYEELWFEEEEVSDLGNGVGLSVVAQKARLVGSSGEVLRLRQAVVSEWVDGLMVRVTVYYDPNEARAAAERFAEERG